jgi:hypothetical protein
MKKRSKHAGYTQPPFKPTKAQRKLVSMLIAMHVSWDDIRELIINPTTGNPICKETLSKFFRRELAAGGAELKKLAATKYFQALSRGKDWAVKWTLRNRFGWVGEGSLPVPLESLGELKNEGITINFVTPSKKVEQLVDITPPAPSPSPYEGQAADYNKPAIEPPRPRQSTPFGSIWEQPKSNNWMK